MSIALHGERLDEPELPSGQLMLEAPPRIEPQDAAGGVLMNAIPLLGTLGSIVLVAGLGRASGSRGYLRRACSSWARSASSWRRWTVSDSASSR